MKTLQVMLSSAAVVGVSILVYDRFVRLSEPATSRDVPTYGDGSDALTPREGVSRALTARMAEQDRRLGTLEATIASLRDDVTRVAGLAEAAAAKGVPKEGSPRSPDDALDEGGLAVLALQMEELARRREARRQATMVKRKLDQLGVAFDATEQAAVLQRMVEFQVAVSELWNRVRDEVIDDKEQIASDYTALTEAAAGDLHALLPAEKAKAVIEGFFTTGPPGHRPPR
jgi:DNA-binding phage protein